MEMNLGNIESFKVAELNKPCKERELTLRKGATKVVIQIAQSAFEEVLQMMISTQEQEGDNPKEEEMDEEDDEEEGDGLATVPKFQQEEEDNLPTGARLPTRSHVSFTRLTPANLEDRQAVRDLKLQLAKLKLAAEEKKVAAKLAAEVKKAESERALPEKKTKAERVLPVMKAEAERVLEEKRLALEQKKILLAH